MSKLLAVFICLLAVCLPASGASAPTWVEVRSPHFVVLTDTNEKQGRKLAGQFERMRDLFRSVLPHAGGDAGTPIVVFALRDRKSFQSLEPASYLAKGQLNLAGLFMTTRDRNYILLRLDTEDEHPFAVVYHEYTHFIVRGAEWLPLWLNEGLAEFYQNTDILDKSVRLGQPSTNDILYLREHKLIPVQTLFAVDHSSPYYHEEEKGSVFYAESWALTHYLEINDFKAKTHLIQDYVNLVAKQTDPVVAAEKAFGDLGKLQRQLDGYIQHGDYQLFAINLAFKADEASYTARAIPDAEVDAARANVLAANGRVAEAKTLVEHVLAADPKSALAHETMGMIANREHDIPAAKKWYGEAVALDSQSYLAHYYYGILSLMEGDTGKDESIESSLHACIKIEPSFAPAYDALANFLISRQKSLDEAYKMTLYATQLAPEELNYRYTAAHILTEQKNFTSAQSVLSAAAKLARTPDQSAQVQRMVEQTKKFQEWSERADAARAAGGHEVPQGTVHTTIGVNAGSQVAVDVSSGSTEDRKYPVPALKAPHHTVQGVVHNVKCLYPTVLTLSLESAGKATALFTPNYFKTPFFTLNFKPAGDGLDPCKMMDGLTAHVEYVDVTDKEFAGQVVSVQLTK